MLKICTGARGRVTRAEHTKAPSEVIADAAAAQLTEKIVAFVRGFAWC
jgi:hypothetical protein